MCSCYLSYKHSIGGHADAKAPNMPVLPKISVSVPEIKFSPEYFDNLLKNINWTKIIIR